MLAQTIAANDDMARTHRESHMDVVRDIAGDKTYVTKTFGQVSEYVTKKLNDIDNLFNGTVAEYFENLNQKVKALDEALASAVGLGSQVPSESHRRV